MATESTFIAWAESLESMNYYDILRVPPAAQPAEIQKAFHEQSLRCHPDRFVEEGDEVSRAAAVVFKRLVEAYRVLRRPSLRERYDAELKTGAITIDEHAVKATAKPAFAPRMLHMIARGTKAKQFAARADTLLSHGRLEEARIQLISAHQNDPGNAELKERLDILYEALCLEPP